MDKPLIQRAVLRKLIDIPLPIVKDLKVLSVNADKSLKSYIESLLVERVRIFREKK